MQTTEAGLPGIAERACRVLGWTATGLGLAAWAALRLQPPTDADRRDLEDLVLVPVGLGILALAFAVLALGSLAVALAGAWARPGARTWLPGAGAAAVVLVPVLVVVLA